MGLNTPLGGENLGQHGLQEQAVQTDSERKKNEAFLISSALITPLTVEIPSISPADLERLSVEYSQTRDEKLRDSLVIYHQKLVRSIATRFLGAGETLEDLIQVGNIGLINALDRYNPAQGTRFSTYATPTILGEIKRHFRDKTSPIKIPRWLQEMHQATRRANYALTNELRRPPTVAEIADRLGVTEEQITESMGANDATNPLSLDTHLDGQTAMDSASLLDFIGKIDKTLLDFETFEDLRTALDTLGEREREVLTLRFFEDLSQVKIAKQLNISQMHVSRLQQRALKHLRDCLSDEIRATRSPAKRKPVSAQKA